jgi:hypothetical protein
VRKTRKEIRDEIAEDVCRELRWQISNGGKVSDVNLLANYLLKWMEYTNKNKYERPTIKIKKDF